jgi:HK97 family phage major capsid protein
MIDPTILPVFARVGGRLQRVSAASLRPDVRAALSERMAERLASPLEPNMRNETTVGEDVVVDVVGRAFAKVQENFDRFADAQKQRTTELGDKQQEIQARVLELEQKAARRPNAAATGNERRGRLSEAAPELLAGLQRSSSARVELAFSPKAGLSSGSVDGTTYVVPTESLGPVSTYHAPIARLINLMATQKVAGNKVAFVRINYASGSPAGNQAAVVAERASKPESSVETELVEVDISTYAHWIDASKQVLDDVAELQSILDGILTGGLLDKVDAGIYSQLVADATSFSPQSGEAIGDSIARAAAQIAQVGGQNIIVTLNPGDYLSMQLAKADSSGVYLGVPASLASRVVAVPAVASGKLLAFAPGSGATWADREGVNVQIGLKNDDFTKNIRTILAECRGATLVRDAQHVVYGDLTAA